MASPYEDEEGEDRDGRRRTPPPHAGRRLTAAQRGALRMLARPGAFAVQDDGDVFVYDDRHGAWDGYEQPVGRATFRSLRDRGLVEWSGAEGGGTVISAAGRAALGEEARWEAGHAAAGEPGAGEPGAGEPGAGEPGGAWDDGPRTTEQWLALIEDAEERAASAGRPMGEWAGAAAEARAVELGAVATWALGDDTGLSSKAMARRLAGLAGPRPALRAYPLDADDFGRCARLLRAVPALRARLSLMAQDGPIWEALADAWPALEAAYEALEAATAAWVASGYGVTAPETYAAHRAAWRAFTRVLAAARHAGDPALRAPEEYDRDWAAADAAEAGAAGRTGAAGTFSHLPAIPVGDEQEPDEEEEEDD